MYLVRPPFFLQWYYPNLIWHKPTHEKIVYLTFDDGPIPNVTDFVLDTLKNFDIKATFFCIGDNIDKHPTVFERIRNEGHTVGNHSYHHLKGWKTDDTAYLEDFEKCQALTQTNLFRPPYGRIKKSQIRSLKSKVESQQFAERTSTLNPKPYTANLHIRELKDQRPKLKAEVKSETLKVESVKLEAERLKIKDKGQTEKLKPESEKSVGSSQFSVADSQPFQPKAENCQLQIIMWDVLSGDFDTSISADRCYRNVINNVKNGSIIVFHDSLKAWERLEYALPKTIEHLRKLGYRFEKL